MYAGLGGQAKDEREAARLCKLSADQGNARGQDNLGVLYLDGLGGLRGGGGMQWGVFRMESQFDRAKDELGAQLLEVSADQGEGEGGGGAASDWAGQSRGASASEKVLSAGEKGEREAARLYSSPPIRATRGRPGGGGDLGFLHEKGREGGREVGGLPKDERQAARLFKLVRRSGQPPAQANSESGTGGLGGLAKDEREAARLFKLSADQGNA